MADDPRPEDDATRIYRPYGSPPPDEPATPNPPPAGPDPFAPDPFAPDAPASGAPDPFSPDPFAPAAADPWAADPAPSPPASDPFAPDPTPAASAPSSPDPFAPEAPASPDPWAADPTPAASDPFPAPSAADPFAPPPSHDPFTPPVSSDPFAAPSGSDPFGPPSGSDPVSAPSGSDPFAAPSGSDPFAPPSGSDPFAPPSGADPFAAPSAPDPFRASEAASDPFAPLPAERVAPPPEADRPSPPPAPDPFAPLPPDPFAVAPADPFAPPPPVPAPAPPPRAPDPFSAAPATASSDPFATLKGPALGGGAFDSSIRDLPHGDPGGMDLPDAFGTEQSLAGAFAPVFSLILQLRAAERLGDATGLRQRIEALLAEAARAARKVGAPDADVDEATFCLIAFLDEAILGTEWAGHDAWSAQPLQLTHYDRYDAGEQVFDRLKRLLDEGGTRTAVLEVYYLCLALGFKGRYAIQGREVLRRLVDDLHGRLERANGAPGALSPRGRSREVPTEAEKAGIPTWALWVGAAVLVALLYIGLSVSLSGVARETADDLRSLSAAPAE